VFIVVGLTTCLVQGQSQKTVSVRIDPDDWNQFIYTQSMGKTDTLTFLYWVKRNKDQFARVAWQRSSKVKPSLSLIYGFGTQLLSNKAGTDPQAYGLVGARLANKKTSAISLMNFNISFRRPLLVKNMTAVQTKLNKVWTLGYRHEIIKSSKGLWPEVRVGGTADYALNKKLSLGIWVYRNAKTSRFGGTYIVSYKF
jgi:hypothetical protein